MADSSDDLIGRVEAVQRQVDRLSTSVDQRFDQVDERFNQVDERFNQVDERFNQVDERFNRVDERFSQMEHRFNDVDAALLEQRMYTDFAYQQLDTNMGAGFARLERKLDQFIDAQLKTNELVERRLTALERPSST